MGSAGHVSAARDSYDAVAVDYARLLSGLSVETALDVAVIDEFVGRSLALGVGPVADVGCGPGRVTAHLHARGVNVFGIDLSAGMIRVARREHPNLTQHYSRSPDQGRVDYGGRVCSDASNRLRLLD